MNKEEFLGQLRSKLAGLPEQELDERITFYEEMIDDRIEDGASEQEAVEQIGSPDEIVDRIMSEIPLSKLVKNRVKPEKKHSTLWIVLIILGFPIWFPLVITVFSLVLSLFITLWSLIITVYALALSFSIAAVAMFIVAIILLITGRFGPGILSAGVSLIIAAIAILTVLFSILTTKGGVFVTKKIVLGIKSLFVGKGDAYDEKIG